MVIFLEKIVLKNQKLMINNNSLKHKKLASKSSKKLSQLVLQKDC
jgi:hypothetical protein